MRRKCLRLKKLDESLDPWRMWTDQEPDHVIEANPEPVLIANHTDALLRAALDGAGITSVSLDIIAPHLSRGELVRVLKPLFTAPLAIYVALPSRKFILQRTQMFLEYFSDKTREQNKKALATCAVC